MRRVYGFTLVEVLIASALLSLFLIAAFGIYSSGSESFLLGNWRLHAQKDAQRFLSMLASDLAQANNCESIRPEDIQLVAATPIYINKDAFSKEGEAFKTVSVTGNSWTPILFFSISKPAIEGNKFSVAKSGTWKGVSLWANSGRLHYVRTGDPAEYSTKPSNMPGVINDYRPADLGPGMQFEPASERFSNIMLENVSSIGFQYRVKAEEKAANAADTVKKRGVLYIEVSLRRPNHPETTLTESISASLLMKQEDYIKTF